VGSSFALSFDRDGLSNSASATEDMHHHASSNSAATKASLRPHLEQEILETIMAAPPTQCDMVVANEMITVVHHGNLARELLQVYHALARHEPSQGGAGGGGMAHTRTNVLTGRDAIVYINRHLAVVIEAVSLLTRQEQRYANVPPWSMNRASGGKGAGPFVRIPPYWTLFFPTVSPKQLLASLVATTNHASSPRRLERLLQCVNPQKTLSELASEANLTVPATIEIASLLVDQGVCLVLPVVSRNMRLACRGIDSIREHSLAFAQDFGPTFNLFGLVSFLTDAALTLGETMSMLTGSNESLATMVREGLLAMLSFSVRGDNGSGKEEALAVLADDLEDIVYQLVVWLCSHQVVVQLQDYLISAMHPDSWRRKRIPAENHATDRHSERKSDSHGRLDSLSDEGLYRVLWESDCLSGTVSMPACCWKLSIDPVKLQSFLTRNEFIRCVRRIPMAGDDWGAVYE
jgi:hypothetical protein